MDKFSRLEFPALEPSHSHDTQILEFVMFAEDELNDARIALTFFEEARTSVERDMAGMVSLDAATSHTEDIPPRSRRDPVGTTVFERLLLGDRSRLMFLWARSFVGSLHMAAMYLENLTRQDPAAAGIFSGLGHVLHGLKHVRDSDQHRDERLQRQARIAGKVRAFPSGPVWIGHLSKNSYRFTGADGHQHAVEISDATLQQVATTLGDTIRELNKSRVPSQVDPRQSD